MPRLPQGLDPVQAGRFGLWLLSRRSHEAKLRRVAFPARVWRSLNFGKRFERLIVPWRIYEYPGPSAFIAAICSVSQDTARGWFYGRALPKKHALRLAQYLEQHASECEALAREMRAYEKNRRSGNKKR